MTTIVSFMSVDQVLSLVNEMLSECDTQGDPDRHTAIEAMQNLQKASQNSDLAAVGTVGYVVGAAMELDDEDLDDEDYDDDDDFDDDYEDEDDYDDDEDDYDD